jgi:hypothetical protein
MRILLTPSVCCSLSNIYLANHPLAHFLVQAFHAPESLRYLKTPKVELAQDTRDEIEVLAITESAKNYSCGVS